jgi:hypothetical protein
MSKIPNSPSSYSDHKKQQIKMSALVITSILALGFLGLFLLGRFGSNPNYKNKSDNDYWNNKVSMVRVVSDINSYDLRQETMGLMYISPLIGNDRNINIQGSRQNNLIYYQDLNNQGNNTIFFRTFANTNNTFMVVVHSNVKII